MPHYHNASRQTSAPRSTSRWSVSFGDGQRGRRLAMLRQAFRQLSNCSRLTLDALGCLSASAVTVSLSGSMFGVAVAGVLLASSASFAADYSAGGGVINTPSGNATAVGSGATTTGTYASAFGASSTANGLGATATGVNSFANGDAATATGDSSTANGLSATAIGASTTAVGTNAAAIGTGSAAIGNFATATGANSQATGDSATAVGQASVANGSVATAVGQSSNATGVATTAIGQASVATATGATALGTAAQALALNSVAIGSGSVATLANTVSFGTSGNERRLTNVAAGINPTDAVNMSQLTGLTSGFQSQLNSLQSQVGELDGRVKNVGALGAALAGLHPNPRAKGDNAIAGAVGVYRGQPAIAAGYFRHLGDQVMLSVGASTTGNEWSANTGVTYSW